MDTAQFEEFRRTIHTLDLEACTSWPQALLMRREDDWATYYAPFDFVNKDARVVLVGITPGFTQALNALRSAQAGLREGRSTLDILKSAKTFASFSGPMRTNLIAMLDAIGIQRLLGTHTTADLFKSKKHLVHFTSALRYPVTLRGGNYSGTPGITRHAFTRDELRWLAEEVRTLNSAVFVPLGPAATGVLQLFQNQDLLRHEQILAGLPHPSGANAERIAYFLRKKSRQALSSKVDAEKLDKNRALLEEQVARLV